MGPLCLAVSLLGILAALRGPYAFVRRLSLILAPLYAPGFSVDEIAEIRRILERELAAEGSHALYPKSLIENFYLERDNAADVFHGDYLGKDEAFALGEGLGVERTAIATAAKYSGRLNLTLTIYDIETDQRAGRAGFSTRNIETLEAWENTNGEPLDLAGELDIQVPGFSAGALLYLGWLAAFGILGTVLCIKYLFLIDWRPARAAPDARIPRMVVETLLSCGLLLLFAWIYALNGDMDYVQRFVATSGVLRLDDTRVERAAALIRYLPPMLLLSVLWLLDARQRPALPQPHTFPDSTYSPRRPGTPGTSRLCPSGFPRYHRPPVEHPLGPALHPRPPQPSRSSGNTRSGLDRLLPPHYRSAPGAPGAGLCPHPALRGSSISADQLVAGNFQLRVPALYGGPHAPQIPPLRRASPLYPALPGLPAMGQACRALRRHRRALS